MLRVNAVLVPLQDPCHRRHSLVPGLGTVSLSAGRSAQAKATSFG